MRKRVFCIVLSCFLLAGLFTSCNRGPATDGSFRIAIALPDTGAAMFHIMSNNVRQLATLMGGEVVFERTPLTPDGVMSFVENQIAAGSNGFIIIPPADAILPAVMAMAETAGVY